MATVVVQLLLGHIEHARQIVESIRPEFLKPADHNIDEAIQHLRSASPGTDATLTNESFAYHRDGWLFQFISWMVSVAEFPNARVRPPQPRKSEKGFDGLILEHDETVINCVIVLEDKASESPRATIRDDVFRSFKTLEQGLRDNELTAEISTLLENIPNLSVADVARNAQKLILKRYRASIACSSAAIPPVVHVFADYELAVPGTDDRRLANLFVAEDMRVFFEDLSARAISMLEDMREMRTA